MGPLMHPDAPSIFLSVSRLTFTEVGSLTDVNCTMLVGLADYSMQGSPALALQWHTTWQAFVC